MKGLSSDRWQQIDALFSEALGHAPEARAAFLRDACGDDTALFEEVQALLDSDAEAEQFLGDSVTVFAASLLPGLHLVLDEETTALTDHRIGPYHLLEEIGRGGMGRVYLAERADGQFEKRVALKLVRRGMDTDEILRRFRYERRILATLEHPHIARLYDGGRTDDGRSYLVMEYVDGIPIDRYCDANKLSVAERLHLFQTVGEAVRYAHQNLVVHRDLKPSNILVTHDGRVKLLDFGIAKLLSDDAQDDSAPVTQTGMRVMTPEYAAPEQVRGAAVTTATDVYALGVVLYELLTGRRPLSGAGKSPLEAERAILTAEPERPSTAVSKGTEKRRHDGTTETITPEAVSAVRATTPDRLQRRLRGDLDTILLKALKKEPDRRYASAEAFVEDLRRHLAGLPVQARPDTWGYRLRKFAARNKTTVTAVLAFTLLLLSYAVTVTLQSRRIQAERDLAEQERNKAEEVVTVFTDLFKAADPNEAEGDTLNVYQVLAQSEARIEDELAGQPDVQATMWTVMGSVYRNMGAYDRAAPLLEKALAMRRTLYGSVHERVAETTALLGVVHRDQGDFDDAEPLLREALDLYRQTLGPTHAEIANTSNDLALLFLEQGDYNTAASFFRDALAMFVEVTGPESDEVATVKSSMARLFLETGDDDAAEPLLREALALHRQHLGDTHPQVAATLTNLAALHQQRGEYAQSEAYMRENLALRRKTLGEEHPLLVVSYGNLATVLRPQGKLDEAEPMLRDALTLARKLLGEEHPDVSWILFTLGIVLSDKEAYDEAETLFRQALAVDRKLLGFDHPVAALDMVALANALRDQGRYQTAAPLYRDALALMRTQLPEDHVYMARGLVGYGSLLAMQGNPADGEPLLREGLRIRLATSHEKDWTAADAQARLGACLTALGRYEEAEDVLRRGYQTLRDAMGPESKHTRYAVRGLAVLYETWGKPDEAAAYRALLPREE